MYRCIHCGRVFKRESSFERHRCEAMRRAEMFDTPTGRSAFHIYGMWLKLKRRGNHSAEAFRESMHFRPFYQFAEFAKQTKLNIPVYLDIVTKLDLAPNTWTRDDVYSNYIEYIDRSIPSKQQLTMSVDYIMKMADAMECDTSEVFTGLLPTEMSQLIRDRKLTPWLLLHSRSFKLWLLDQDEHSQLMLQDIIRPMYWRLRFGREPAMVNHAKAVAKALGL